MAISWRLTVGPGLLIAAIGLAAPAAADLTDGTYQANYERAGSHPWVVISCGAECKSIQWDNGEKTGTDTYHLSGNTWTMEAPSGKFNVAKTIDNTTLAGANEADFMGEHIVERFSLVKAG